MAKVGETPPGQGRPRRPPRRRPTRPSSRRVRGRPDADDVEFEIDFDDEPVAADDRPPTKSAPPAAETRRPSPGPRTQEGRKAAAAPEPVATEPDMADEAIADFLLDIKLDDEE